MNEHESNLYDLYAGLAMVGWIINGDYSVHTIPHMAHDVAEQMMKVRKERVREREESEGDPISDMAVSDMEGREDSDTKGIAALKKTRTRPKSS